MPLFNKIDEATAQQLKERFAGKQMSVPPHSDVVSDTASLQEQLDKQVSAREQVASDIVM